MNIKSLISNAATAFLAQGVAMALSILQGLLVPKILGVEQYGYWQLFIFYQSYVGFFHLGLCDGLYLLRGGQRRSEIDKRSVNSQFVFGIFFQSLFALVIVAFALFGPQGPERSFVIFWTGVFLVIQNAATYLGYVFQAMNETKTFSYSSIVERLCFLVPLLFLLLTRTRSFEPYVLSYVFSSCCQLIYCLWHARDFLASGYEGWGKSAKDSAKSIQVGYKLLLSNIASMLILGVARAAIDQVWGIATFGKLSFALSMVNFFSAFVSQAAMVLFPALRQSSEREVAKFYGAARDAMVLLFPFAYVLYFPAIWLLGLWLPDYASSFIYFALLLPICVFDSKMNITCTTLFKVRREEKTLLYVNVAICALSTALTLLGALIIKSPLFIIGSVVVCLVVRSLWSEHHFNCELCVPAKGMSVAELFVTAAYLVAVLCLPSTVAFFVYAVIYLIYILVYRRQLKGLLSSVKRAVGK